MKKKENTIESAELESLRVIADWAEVIGENLEKNSLTNEADPEAFNDYTLQVRRKVINNTADFRTRFTRGYRVLLDELSKELS